MKKQTNIRMSEATKSKLDYLFGIYGTQSEVVAVAIDRLCNDEILTRSRRVIRDAQRGAGKYTLDDYVYLVTELAELLDCQIVST